MTKQQTTAIISKLTFRVTQIRILSHFSSCHALLATPNLDASAVLLLRLSSTPENRKRIKGETNKICWNSFLCNFECPSRRRRRSRRSPPPRLLPKKHRNKQTKNSGPATFVATLNVSTPPNPPNSRLQVFCPLLAVLQITSV